MKAKNAQGVVSARGTPAEEEMQTDQGAPQAGRRRGEEETAAEMHAHFTRTSSQS